MKASLNWLKEYIDIEGSAKDVAHALTMCGLEVESIEAKPEYDDEVIEVEITSNRADWLSHIGIAREYGATQSKVVKYPEINVDKKTESTDLFSVEIKNSEKCPFYSAVLLEDVKFGPTPAYIKNRLEAVGLRSINLPVDITNYVLLETGQPLHAFDFDKTGRNIIIRDAVKGEKFSAINEKEYELTSDDLVIADENEVLALAGVMGGKPSEVSDTTVNILLESALFVPTTVRRTSKKMLLVSDSSYRFERYVDPQGVLKAQQRFISLLLKHGQIGKISEVKQQGVLPDAAPSIEMKYEFVDEVLGMKIDRPKMVEILKCLEIPCSQVNDEGVKVDPPTFRNDLDRPVDLVEEIARIYGYDNIPETLPKLAMSRRSGDKKFNFASRLRDYLSGLGCDEVITFAQVDPVFYEKTDKAMLDEAVKLVNPSNAQRAIMRPSLICSFLDVVRTNINHDCRDVAFYEIGRVYKKLGKDLPLEKETLGLCLSGNAYTNWTDHSRKTGFYDLKGKVEALLSKLRISDYSFNAIGKNAHLNDLVEIVVGQDKIGFIGKVDKKVLKYHDVKQDVFYSEICLGALLKASETKRKFVPYSKFPSSYRDLSLVINKTDKISDIIAEISTSSDELDIKVDVFDEFSGKQVASGKRSVSLSMSFQAQERTLSSDEVDALYEKIISAVKTKFNADLRS